jgi:two-component system cell cycle response regulator
VVNSRVLAFVIGFLGLCAGGVAAAASAPLVGLGAGVLALGAGVLALATRDDNSELEQRLVLHETIEEGLRNELAAGAALLSTATTRVAALEAELADATARPSEPLALPSDDLATLTDQDSQLFSEAYFRVALDARIASARRHLRPVAIALIDLYEGLAGAGAGPANPGRAAESIRETVRDADTACRMADGTFAIILEDTPENGAVWTVERVRRNLVSRFGSHTMWAGVACYPAHAFSSDELMEQARLALESAKEWKQDRIEVAIAE